jgi:hypothetical protein
MQQKSLTELFGQTAFSLGINATLIPPYLRIGSFVEFLSPTLQLPSVKQLLKSIAYYSAFGLGSLAKWIIFRPTYNLTLNAKDESVLVVCPGESANSALFSAGAMGEVALFEDSIFLGARLKKTIFNQTKNFEAFLETPGIKELTLFARSEAVMLFNYLDLPELGFNYSLFFASPEKFAQRSAIRFFLKYRF